MRRPLLQERFKPLIRMLWYVARVRFRIHTHASDCTHLRSYYVHAHSQDKRRVEIILVDAGCKDNTMEVVKSCNCELQITCVLCKPVSRV
jgi:carbamoylphosphate synthase small subunit